MQVKSAKLKKLRGKTFRELRFRGRQELVTLGERIFGLSCGEMTDSSFLRHIQPEARHGSAAETARGIVHRIEVNGFLPALLNREEIVNTMGRRFWSERATMINSAKRAIEGRFDLLGFKNLSFGNPPDWLLEPISGKISALDHWSRIDYLDPAVVGDKKITWELNRHQHFVALGQAYWMTDDEGYARAFVSQSNSWMDSNPPNLGINWASSLELAFRSISWLWSLQLFAGSQSLTEPFKLRLLKYLIAHGLHIQSYLSRYFSPNTHLTGEALGLIYLGIALPELRCARAWRELGLRILIEQMSRQVRADGVYFEQATYYHRYTTDFYLHLAILGRAAGIELPSDVEQRLVQMITHLMFLMRPDGSSPLIGDDDGGRVIALAPREQTDFRDTLATAAALYERSDWKRAAGDAPVETLWLLGPEGLALFDELSNREPRECSHVFQSGGYSVMRDGWKSNSTYALIDFGPHGSLGCGHAHADSLAIEFAARGKTWIVDPGTFTYTGNQESRDWFRSTAAHSTVTVDGESQSVPAGPFSWKHIAETSLGGFIIGDGFDFLEASHDGYRRLADPVTHTRALIFPKSIASDEPASLSSYLIVRDSFAASKRHQYEATFHLTPGCSAYANGSTVLVEEPDGFCLRLAAFGHPSVRAKVIDGWVSRAYGQRERAPIAVFDVECDGPVQLTTFVIPTTAEQPILFEELKVEGVQSQAFQIVTQDLRDVLLVSDGSQLCRCGPLASDARISWSRFVNDDFLRAFLIGGQQLETTDGFAFRTVTPIDHASLFRNADGLRGSINGDSFEEPAPAWQRRHALANGTSYEIQQRLSGLAGSGPAGGASSSIEALEGAIN